MSRLKKMPLKIRNELEKAAGIIASGSNKLKMWIVPRKWEGFKIVTPTKLSECRHIDDNITLMQIALMLTMPEEILNHECCKKNFRSVPVCRVITKLGAS